MKKVCMNWPQHDLVMDKDGLMELLKAGEDSYDTELVAGERVFKAHKAVLSAASVYFQWFFSTGRTRLVMSPNVASVTPFLLEYIYRGHTKIYKHLMGQLFDLAGSYGVKTLTPSYQRRVREDCQIITILEFVEAPEGKSCRGRQMKWEQPEFRIPAIPKPRWSMQSRVKNIKRYTNTLLSTAMVFVSKTASDSSSTRVAAVPRTATTTVSETVPATEVDVDENVDTNVDTDLISQITPSQKSTITSATNEITSEENASLPTEYKGTHRLAVPRATSSVQWSLQQYAEFGDDLAMTFQLPLKKRKVLNSSIDTDICAAKGKRGRKQKIVDPNNEGTYLRLTSPTEEISSTKKKRGRKSKKCINIETFRNEG